MFVARDARGELVNVLEDKLEKQAYTCPACGGQLHLRQGPSVRTHFAHKSLNPNHSYLSQLDVTYKTPDLMSHFLPPHEVSFTF
ncbi:competence protein CoiA family protein, partial [Streptococcus pneumoniae]|uniref:competence protein CoiA family protein n=1 Tax=Streptococcus pneumoniae TaxID=1313 RepID=UPI000B31E7D3